jgi:phage FluMu gp28-like protein
MGTPNPDELEPYSSLPRDEFDALKAWASTFYNFQLDWLFETAARAIANKSRQIGISHTTSAIAVLWGAFHGELTTIISLGDRESTEVLEFAHRHAQVLCGLGSVMARPVTRNAHEIKFASGGRVLALPSSGGRGFSGNVVLDEYAYQPHSAEVWDASAAATTLGYRLRVVSTPNGSGNDFAELWQRALDPDTGWAPHEIPVETAIAQGYPVDEAELWEKAKGDPRLYDQLYRCKFIDTELQYIPSDLFAACFAGEVLADGAAFGGLDIGETRDKTVLTILRRNGDELGLQHIETHGRTDEELIARLVAKAFGAPYGCSRVAVDATGLGTFPARTLRRKWGSRVEPVKFTLQVKEDLATRLYDVVARQVLRIPSAYVYNGTNEIPLLRDDVHAIRRIVTSAGNVRYDAQRTTKGHADRAWSLMLALHAAGRMSRMAAALSKS